VTSGRGDAERWASDAGQARSRDRRRRRRHGAGGRERAARCRRRDDVLGIVPVGSGNDLARSLRPAARPGRRAGRRDRPREHDDRRCACAGRRGRTRWFASAGGVGFDAAGGGGHERRRGWQRGPAGYLVTALSELRGLRTARSGSRSTTGRPSSAVLSWQSRTASTTAGVCTSRPARSSTTGCSTSASWETSRGSTALAQLPNLYRGRHTDHPAVEMRLACPDRRGRRDTLVHLDGEPFGGLPLRVELRPGRAHRGCSGCARLVS
jgi:diacylglycerol kinase (ATP)